MALARRQPAAGAAASLRSRQPVRQRRLPARCSPAHGIVCSMSRRGNCWDNAVAESFFATLKIELVHDAAWATRAARARRGLRVPRGLLQRAAAPFVARLPQPRAFERQWAATEGTRSASRPIAGPAPSTREPRRGSRSDADEGGRYLGYPPKHVARAHHRACWYSRGRVAHPFRAPVQCPIT